MGVSKANVFSLANMDAMDAALDRLENDPELAEMGVVLAVPEGKKTFSAGLDMQVVMGLDQQTFGEYIGRFDRLMWRLFNLKRPVVGAVTGNAIAGGFVLMCACDWRVGMEAL